MGEDFRKTARRTNARKVPMDEKYLILIVFGTLFVAFGGFASFMDARQKEQERREEKNKPRRLRPSDQRRRGLRD
jgi:hypothetical protein